MTRALVLLFLGASPEAHEADLEAWARARMVEIREPEADVPDGLAYPAEAAAQIEAHLEAARLAFATLDDAGARARLADAERLLRQRPELPQAAWLMAERLEIEADAAGRAGDLARAGELRRRAQLLEGARAPSFGPSQTPPTQPSLSTLALSVTGLAPGDRLYWNGVLRGKRFRDGSGEHHARVVRRGRAVWAGWVEARSGASTIALPVPAPVPCSLDDLAGARIVGDRAIARRGARCERWAIARPSALGGVDVATCHAASCGPLIHWQKGYGVVYAGPPQPRAAPGGLPTWATVALVGAGAALVGSVVAWRAGAFDDPEPAGTSWRFYGP